MKLIKNELKLLFDQQYERIHESTSTSFKSQLYFSSKFITWDFVNSPCRPFSAIEPEWFQTSIGEKIYSHVKTNYPSI